MIIFCSLYCKSFLNFPGVFFAVITFFKAFSALKVCFCVYLSVASRYTKELIVEKRGRNG